MQSTEAMRDEQLIGRISMRVEPSSQPRDDTRRSARAEALTRWLLDEWQSCTRTPKELAA